MSGTLESMVARALAAEGLEILQFDMEGAEVRLPGHEAVSALHFGNLRRLLAGSPAEDHEPAVARFVRIWAATARRADARLDDDDPSACLFPRVVPPGNLEGLVGPWAEPLAGGALQLMLVVDRAESVRYVTPFDLPRWKLGLRDARARAMQNLEAASQGVRDEIELATAAVATPVAWRIETGDGYDAARLLLIQRWMPGALGVLATVPSRDLMVAVPVFGPHTFGASLEHAARAWQEAAVLVRRSPYPLSPLLYWRTEDELEPVPIGLDDDGRVAIGLAPSLRRVMDASAH